MAVGIGAGLARDLQSVLLAPVLWLLLASAGLAVLRANEQEDSKRLAEFSQRPEGVAGCEHL